MVDYFEDYGYHLEPAHTSRGARVQTLTNMSAYVDQRRIQFFEGHCNDTLDEMESVQRDENSVEDIQGCGRAAKVPDHGIDDTRYALYAIEQEVEGEKDQEKREGADYGMDDEHEEFGSDRDVDDLYSWM